MPDCLFHGPRVSERREHEPTETPRNSGVWPVPWTRQHVVASFLGTQALKPQSVHSAAKCSPAGLRKCVDPISYVLALLLQISGSPNTPHSAVLKIFRGFSLCQPPMPPGCPQDSKKQSGITRLRLGRATTEMAFTLRLGWILFVQSKVGSALGSRWGRGCTGQGP